jgi:hypothetical protein
MKRLVSPLPLLFLLLTGCAPTTHRAQDAIMAHLRATLPDPSSYVPISFGQPQATATRGDTSVLTHVYQAKLSPDSLGIYSQRFLVDSIAGYVKPVKP